MTGLPELLCFFVYFRYDIYVNNKRNSNSNNNNNNNNNNINNNNNNNDDDAHVNVSSIKI